MENKLEGFGPTIRKLREAKGLFLRQIAANLEVDTAFVSKLERNEKRATRDHVSKLAQVLGVPDADLLTIWLSDKLLDTVSNEALAHSAIQLTVKRLKMKHN